MMGHTSTFRRKMGILLTTIVPIGFGEIAQERKEM